MLIISLTIQKFPNDTFSCECARQGDYADKSSHLLTLPPAEGTGPRRHRSGEDQSFLPRQAVCWSLEVQQAKGSIHCTPSSPTSTASWSCCSWAEIVVAHPNPRTPASPIPWVCVCLFWPPDCKTCSECICSPQAPCSSLAA